MAQINEVEGFVLPISRGLTETITMAGGDRKLMIMTVAGAALFIMIAHQIWTIPFWLILFYVNRHFTKKDTLFFEAWINHMKYKNFYNS